MNETVEHLLNHLQMNSFSEKKGNPWCQRLWKWRRCSVSDVREEGAKRIEGETGDADLAWNDPDGHPFSVPERAR